MPIVSAAVCIFYIFLSLLIMCKSLSINFPGRWRSTQQAYSNHFCHDVCCVHNTCVFVCVCVSKLNEDPWSESLETWQEISLWQSLEGCLFWVQKVKGRGTGSLFRPSGTRFICGTEAATKFKFCAQMHAGGYCLRIKNYAGMQNAQFP